MNILLHQFFGELLELVKGQWSEDYDVFLTTSIIFLTWTNIKAFLNSLLIKSPFGWRWVYPLNPFLPYFFWLRSCLYNWYIFFKSIAELQTGFPLLLDICEFVQKDWCVVKECGNPSTPTRLGWVGCDINFIVALRGGNACSHCCLFGTKPQMSFFLLENCNHFRLWCCNPTMGRLWGWPKWS